MFGGVFVFVLSVFCEQVALVRGIGALNSQVLVHGRYWYVSCIPHQGLARKRMEVAAGLSAGTLVVCLLVSIFPTRLLCQSFCFLLQLVASLPV